MKKYCLVILSIGTLLPLQSIAKTRISTRTNSDVDGYVLVEDDYYSNLQDLPQRLVRDAELAYTNKNYDQAITDLKGASLILQIESAGNAGDSKTELLLAAGDLDRIAGSIIDNSMKSSLQLRAQLMIAMYHQAEYHRQRAVQQWVDKQYKRAGQDMKQSAVAIESLSTWSDKKFAAGVEASIHSVRKVSDSMIKGVGWTRVQVANALGSLETATKAAEDKVMPPESVGEKTQPPAEAAKSKQ